MFDPQEMIVITNRDLLHRKEFERHAGKKTNASESDVMGWCFSNLHQNYLFWHHFSTLLLIEISC